MRRSANTAGGAPTAVLLVVVFVALALVTRILCFDRGQTTVFWAANSAMVAALLILPARHALGCLGACFAANLLLNLITRYSLPHSVLFCTLNVALSFGVAMLTLRHCGAATDLSRFNRLTTFGIISLGGAAVEALAGLLVTSGPLFLAHHLETWLQWTLCDGFGLLIGTPPIMLCFGASPRLPEGDAAPRERWLLLTAAVVLALVSFAFARSPTFLLIYPLLVLIAFRGGPAWVFVSILLISTIAAGMTARGHGPLSSISPSGLLPGEGMVQLFVVSLFLAVVPANAALGEARRSRRRLERLKDDIEHVATRDWLTGLANRELFRRRLAAMVRSRAPFAMLFVDLDGFKEVNDTMGHAAGDQLLRIFAHRVLETVAPDDVVARIGGDEFALLTPLAGPPDHVGTLCRRVLEAAHAAIMLDAGSVQVSASVGVALARDGTETASELMRRADLALYAAKHGGKNRASVFGAPPQRLSA